MSESDQKINIIRDPNFCSSRVFVGNLPICTKEELESIFLPYAKVLGSMVQKNFGFVQLESEEVANKVAAALTKSTFKGHIINVRNAGNKKAQTTTSSIGGPGGILNTRSQKVGINIPLVIHNNNCNDCEIIVVDRKNTKYAEMIEERLKRLNLRVDVLFPNEDVPLGKVLSNIASRGCLYAILVTNQHQEHNSITVNILQGQPTEHRNMPVDDAIKLIADDFHQKVRERGLGMGATHLPKSVPIIPAAVTTAAKSFIMAPPLKERHPDAIQTLINLLTDNLPLTVVQYDRIIKYLQDRRELQLKVELGDAADASITSTIIKMSAVPDPEIELQKKILNILNKPSVAETHYELLYPTLQAVKDDEEILDLLKDIKVQKALDALMDSNLVATVENLMKF